jgi:hypothetical protein
MMEKNPFGGRKGSLYTPLSEDEQEVLSRLVNSQDLRVIVKDWATIDQPRVVYGDLRLSLAFRIHFTRPEVPLPVHFFDLELRTGAGMLLFKERQSTMYGGKPIEVADGVFMDMVWDIAIMAMDPKVVKALKPGARGLTSRWQDRDTGELTLMGNARLSRENQKLLRKARQGEARNRTDTLQQVQKAETKAAEVKAGRKTATEKVLKLKSDS